MMNHSETSKILGMLAAYDRRTISESEIHAWQNALNDQQFTDCQLAVQAHYRTTRQFAMPSDIRSLAVLAANDRANRRQAEHLQQLTAAEPKRPTHQIAEILADALEWTPERREQEMRRRNALAVKCPVAWCSAATGQGCKTSNGRALADPHSSRHDTARAGAAA